MGRNSNLQAAKKNKNDEFYTQYNDIANEISHYREQLQGKRILCNCDFDATNPLKKWEVYNDKEGLNLPEGFKVSKCNFIQYFIDKITLDIKNGTKEWNIKSLTATGINPETGYGLRFEDVDYSNYDVVITNPPFSLFGDFIDVMMKNKMKFIILGNKNAITRKNIFTLMRTNELWLGFTQPSDFIDISGKKSDKMKGLTRWFTNIDIEKKHTKMVLVSDYNLEDYPKYDNIDAINVDKVALIPDYDGVMGVPITFLDKYCPDQFEILGIANTYDAGLPYIKGKVLYARLLIKRREDNKA